MLTKNPVTPMTHPRVQTTYDGFALFTSLVTADGQPFSEYTDGKDVPDLATIRPQDRNRLYQESQRRQFDYLLDEVHFFPGCRVLDIGCGNGSLLARAVERGASSAVGLTISPAQVEHCQSRNLDARLMNYRDMGEALAGQFNSVVANGSGEHFCQPEWADRQDEIYHDLFELVAMIIDPDSPTRRFATTMIHFKRETDPNKVLGPFWRPLLRGDWYHCQAAVLLSSFGCWYPHLGQLERCANPHFRLVREEDGTEDYRRTSEEWLRRILGALFTFPNAAGTWRRLLATFLRWPRQSALMFNALVLQQSWMWQFRPNKSGEPPMQLLRQTWELT